MKSFLNIFKSPTFKNVAFRILKRTIILIIALVVVTFITVIIANYGGYIDEIIKSELKAAISQSLARNPDFVKLPPEEQERIINERLQVALHARGLDQPFWIRVFRYTWEALTFQLAKAYFLRSASGSSNVLDIISERLPWTVLLFVTGTIFAAIIGIPIGLYMARKILSGFDKVMVVISVLTYCIPAWFFGILFIYLFSCQFKIFPPGGVPPFREPIWLYICDVLYYLALPLITWIVAFFGYWAYLTRSLVVNILEEDFVIAAKARGLPSNLITTRYILKPISPALIATTALNIVFAIQGAIVTETVFNWPGLGRLYFEAIMMADAPVIIQLTVFYAYLLVITVLILDIVYAIIDPRIRTGIEV